MKYFGLKPSAGGCMPTEEAMKLIESYVPPAEPKGKKGRKKDPIIPPLVSSLEFLVLEDIECVDADGNVFEQYDHLEVAKDIFRKEDGKEVIFIPYGWIVHCEQKGLFLPSFALSCNIVAALYAKRTHPDAERVLHQYKNRGDGHGYHGQNTMIDYAAEEVIHYPSGADFGKQSGINGNHPRHALGFQKSGLHDGLLKDMLGDSDHEHFVRQLTGLRTPEVLVEIGDYFGQPAKLWFPWNGQNGVQFKEKRAAWFGCYFNYFYLLGLYYLSYSYAARGVRRSAP